MLEDRGASALLETAGTEFVALLVEVLALEAECKSGSAGPCSRRRLARSRDAD